MENATLGESSAASGVNRSAAFMTSSGLYVSSLLANFFEAGWSIQVLIGDADQAQYESSRLARPEVEKHLRQMVGIAEALPEHVRMQMPKVDWQSWMDLSAHVPPQNAHDRALVWTAINVWLPPDGQALRRYRRQLPELWRFMP
jgi:uncharacterized protein with HEPN domain